jgi:type II secretory ATPase GspE/PulE/Tfp pilus assembly ATPase PilB-like protein
MPQINSTSLEVTETPEIREQLGAYLLAKKLVTPTQLHAALAEQRVTHERLGRILTRDGFITQKVLLDAVLSTNPERIQGDALFTARVPEEVLMRTRTMIVAETDTQTFLGTLTSERQVRAEIQPYYPGIELVFVATNFEQLDQYLEELRSGAQDEGNLIDRLLRQALSEGASDLHIVPRYGSYSVFFRRLGVRRHVHEGSLDEYNTLSARIKDLSRMDLAERRIPQDGGFQLEHNSKLVDLRVATSPTGTAEYIVIRLLDPDRVQPSLEGLGITRVAEWRKGISRPHGICLICGPTGSGKTTTLNATLREMDRFGSAIFTLEDPVEYRIPYIAQVSTNPALGLDFASGVRAFMRQDPDVIVIGEIRDAETARNAIKAADTGHLVVGTLHTGSIIGAVQRLRDLGVPPSELVYLLRSVLVQRLMRVVCDQCHGEGCIKCATTGYSSRTIVSECAYFPREADVLELVAGTVSWPEMLDDAISKYQEGQTTKQEVIRVFGEEARAVLEGEYSNAPL